MDQRLSHEIRQDILRVAQELGRAPTAKEYLEQKMGRFAENQIRKAFKNFALAKIACGLQGADDRVTKRKVSSEELFGADLDSHLEAYEAKQAKLPPPFKGKRRKIAAMGDLHFPFVKKAVLEAFYKFIESEQPDVVIQCGDLYDMFSAAKFPRSHNVYTPKQEMETARRMATEFWARVRKTCPKAKLYQIVGNHDVRPLKRILETCPELEIFINLEPYFTFPGVETYMDPRHELMIDGIMFHHGYRSKLGDHRDFVLGNMVVGHTHLGGVTFRQIRNQTLWELNCGYAGDADSKALSYTSQKTVKWTHGWGFIDEYGPRFIPFT